MKACEGFVELMAWQTEEMSRAIKEDQQRLTKESGGNDVGRERAEQHFTTQLLEQCATGWRKKYCGSLCEYREGCALGKAMVERKEESDDKT